MWTSDERQEKLRRWDPALLEPFKWTDLNGTFKCLLIEYTMNYFQLFINNNLIIFIETFKEMFTTSTGIQYMNCSKNKWLWGLPVKNRCYPQY